jgi:hypothetical protein
MIDIRIDSKKEGKSWISHVTVNEADEQTYHTVAVPLPDYVNLTSGKVQIDRLIEESFLFLLERERKEEILSHFDIMTIARYFPEYPAEIRKRLRISRAIRTE